MGRGCGYTCRGAAAVREFAGFVCIPHWRPRMPYDVTLIPGDGTGPEISEATRRVLEATGVQFDWNVQQAGLEMLEKYGTVLPDEVIESIKQTKVGLKGPITTPFGKGSR